MGSIYKITNKTNNKCYIGQAQDIKTRFKNHRANAFCKNEKNKNNIPKLYNAFRKYGLENFEFKILIIVENFELDRLEKLLIIHYNSIQNGYNITPGGNTQLGVKRSEETKAKISKVKQGTLTSEKAREMAKMRIGSHQTQKTKDKMSKSHLGKIFKQETKDKLANSKIQYTYYLKDPQGIHYVTTNMHEFSKNFGLIRPSMNKVCSGQQHHHKGWTCTERVKLIK